MGKTKIFLSFPAGQAHLCPKPYTIDQIIYVMADIAFNIRRAEPQDLDAIRLLFDESISAINVKEEDAQQIYAWSAGLQHSDQWEQRIKNQYLIVAELEAEILGFGSITQAGYIDLLFVHKDYQQGGMASHLLLEMETFARQLSLKEIWADVCLDTIPFFEAKGFIIIEVQSKTVKGAEFLNTAMIKRLE